MSIHSDGSARLSVEIEHEYPRGSVPFSSTVRQTLGSGLSDPVLTEVEGHLRFPRRSRLSLLLAALRNVLSDNKTLPK